MASNVTEKQARDVVEAAREADWKLPSFGKELFLGDFRLDLIHPQPRLDPDAGEKGERFLARVRGVLEAAVGPLAMGGAPERMFGSEAQKRKWLPLVAKDHISAFLLTEPDVGSDPARMGSIATPVYDDLVATA